MAAKIKREQVIERMVNQNLGKRARDAIDNCLKHSGRGIQKDIEGPKLLGITVRKHQHERDASRCTWGVIKILRDAVKYHNMQLFQHLYVSLRSNHEFDVFVFVLAEEHENLYVMQLLIQNNNLKDVTFKFRFLHAAVKNGKLEEARAMFRQIQQEQEHYSDPRLEHIKLLFDAISSCDKDTIEYFIKRFEGYRPYCEVCYQESVEYDAYFKNVARRVIESGKVEFVELLIEQFDKYSITISHLQRAIQESNNLYMRIIIEKKNLLPRTDNNTTSLGVAIEAGCRAELVKYLLQQRASDGEPPFIPSEEHIRSAAMKKDPALLQLLLELNNDRVKFDPSSYFEYAVRSRHLAMASFLFQKATAETMTKATEQIKKLLITAIVDVCDIEMIMLVLEHASSDAVSSALTYVNELKLKGRFGDCHEEEPNTSSIRIFECLYNAQMAFNQFNDNKLDEIKQSLNTAYCKSPSYFCRRMKFLMGCLDEKSRSDFIVYLLDTINQNVGSDTLRKLPQQTKLSETEKTCVQKFKEYINSFNREVAPHP